MSMNLPAMFDQNPPHTLDQMVGEQNLRRRPLVIGVMPTRTQTQTAVKQYVDPNPTGGVDIITWAYNF